VRQAGKDFFFMKILVTGAAGFIGSHLSERLTGLGHEVVGIDCFTDYYPRKTKEQNLKGLLSRKNFKLVEANLLTVDLAKLLKNVEVVFHKAAQAGVRASWGKNFETYADNNILATQKLLEACKNIPLNKFIYASSSSVYGNTKDLPAQESSLPFPVSPYGVSKLAAENLSMLYHANYSVPVICLRYFTVFGPRQRPDMAFNKFIVSIMKNQPITIYGNGKQTRDFTFISDVIEANIQAMQSKAAGEIFNIGGGSRISLSSAIRILENIIKKAKVKYLGKQKGDVLHTFADINKARQMLGYCPKVSIEEGLQKESEWLLNAAPTGGKG
jgi:nucleoside-diphosphate-sugar epimerase